MIDLTKLSVIIPAYNEQGYLPLLLDSISKARTLYFGGEDNIEVIVADNMSTDSTATVARERGCRVVEVQKRTIAAARNGGAAIAAGDVYCFVDADIVIHPDSFNAISSIVSTGGHCGGATGWVLERYSFGLRVTQAVEVSLTRIVGVSAGIVFCRADVFDEVGGYNEDKTFGEDVEFFRAMRKIGKKKGLGTVLTTGTPAVVSTRKFDTHGDWHMFHIFLSIPFRYGSLKNWVHAYWYDENERF